MKSAIIFNTYIGTSNQGDKIIYESLYSQLKDTLDKCFVVEYTTHTKNFSFYQYWRMRSKRRFIENANYKFIMGTNLLSSDIFGTNLQWMIGLLSYFPYKDVIMAGVGTTQDHQSLTTYSKFIYKLILNRKYIHSARDEQSTDLLRQMGVQALNTGCPTLWMLSQEHCNAIPTRKSSQVVFSLSGYSDQCDPILDQKMIDVIENNYDDIFFWCQTIQDEKYLCTLKTSKPIKVVYSLPAYANILDKGNIDYIGTRLHGGVYALQHKCRAIVISIDQRARGFHESNNLPILERTKIEELDNMINSEFKTFIKLNTDNIRTFKKQFLFN